MKTKKLKLLTIFLLLLAFCGGMLGSGCEKKTEVIEDEDGYSNLVEGYIVGTFVCDEVGAKSGEATGNKIQRGYCILVANSENATSPYPMDFYTFDFPNDSIIIPGEIL